MNRIRPRLQELFREDLEDILSFFEEEKLEKYLSFLEDKNEIGGFFSRGDSEQILDRHLIECIFHVYKIITSHYVSHETRVADIGTGPGLPGFLFNCLKIPPKLSLLDSQIKRLKHLENFYLENFPKEANPIQFIYSRAEDVKEKFDLITMRSTIKYPWSAELVIKLLVEGGVFIPFLAKRNYDIEFEKSHLLKCGLSIEKEIDLSELNFLGSRHVKFLKKTSQTKYGFPRAWDVIAKEIKKTVWAK